MFPSGSEFLASLGLPLWLQIQYIAPSSAYLSDYAFTTEPSQACIALPQDEAFYSMLFATARAWGAVSE